MAKRSINLKIPEYKCAVFFLICLCGVLTFIYLGIVPTQKSIIGLERKIKDTQQQVDIQETLLPTYKLLKEEFLVDDNKALPLPTKTRLPREKTDEVFLIVREIANKFNMEALSIVPDLKSLAEDSRFLLFNTVIKGDFFNFRKFLVELGEISYLEHIETIDIQQNAETKEFKINIWIALS